MQELLERTFRRVFNAQNLGIWVLASAIASYMGPFGTFVFLSGFERTILWFTMVAWGLFMIAVSMSVEETFFKNLTFRQEELGRLLVMPPIIIIPLYPSVTAYLAPQPMPISFFEAVVACYLLGGIVTSARFSVLYSTRGAVEISNQNGDAPRLMRRLPDDAKGPILRLSGRDHFVEIVTAEAIHSVRMRLADAVEEMDGVDGLYTHRSHWVAKEAIREIEREGGRHYVISADKERIPVSRGKLAELEDAGIV